MADQESKFVTFNLGKDMFGIDVAHIQEVTPLVDITNVPNSLPFMKGVIDLRGTIVPLVDMRIRFEMPAKQYDQDTAVLVSVIDNRKTGLVVDKVIDVKSVVLNEVQSPEHYAKDSVGDYILGVYRDNEGVIVLLHADKILTREQIAQMQLAINQGHAK